MTNLEIIANAVEAYDIHEYVNTYAGWQRNGYQVKHGEHAKFKIKIWRPVKRKKKDEDDEEESREDLVLVNASFFGESQVEEIKDADVKPVKRYDDELMEF